MILTLKETNQKLHFDKERMNEKYESSIQNKDNELERLRSQLDQFKTAKGKLTIFHQKVF